MTVSASLIEFLITACYIIIFGFLARSICTRYPDSPFAKALGYIY